MASNDSSGLGCLVLFVILCIVGGGVVQGAALAGVAWLGFLIFIGVSAGIVIAIVKAIGGK
ncbi:MAG: hypothetical protein JWN24_4834 [Phycisphaerales bacterium]|nr:hypothetical protein [Phycisphaerales bacterium]